MDQEKSSFRWIVLGLLFFGLFILTICMNCIPPLFKEIGEQIPLTKAQMGTVMGVVTLASLFFAPIGGGLGDKIGPRITLGAAIVIIALGGALRAFAGSAFTLTLTMFIVGAGIAIFGPNMPKALGMWFPKNELAMANGISMAGMGLGGAVGMATAASVLSPVFGGWRSTMVWLGVITLAVGIVWVIVFRDRKTGEGTGGGQSMLASFKKVLGNRDILMLAVFYGLNMAGLMTIISLLPVSLAERGVERGGELVSIMMGVAVIFNIAGGVLSDKAGKRKPFLIVCAIIVGVGIFFFAKATGVTLIIALACAGAAMGTIAPVMMVIPVELKEVGPGLTATAVGLIFMIGNTGGFLGPVIGGKLMDAYGPLSGFITMGIVLIVAAMVILPLKETGTKKQPGDAPASPVH